MLIQRIEKMTYLILMAGTLLSVLLVGVGGIWYLIENGGQSIQPELILSSQYQLIILHAWPAVLSSLTLINIGILILILTQIFRVAMLVVYYYIEKDKWFTLISLFILSVLLYSLLLRHA